MLTPVDAEIGATDCDATDPPVRSTCTVLTPVNAAIGATDCDARQLAPVPPGDDAGRDPGVGRHRPHDHPPPSHPNAARQ
eukprot:3430316-Pyramimonas_sp.AAC.2